MRRGGKLVIWPAYFDADRPRSQGRRVSKGLALRGVKAEEVLQAALDLGLNPVLRTGGAYPKHPWRKSGAVLIDKHESKTDILNDLVRRIGEKRGSK